MALRARVVELERELDRQRAGEERGSKVESLLAAVDDLVVELAEDGTIVYSNRDACAGPDALVGASFERWLSPSSVPFAKGALARVFATGQATSFECQGGRDAAWYAVRLRPIVRDERVASVALTASDITDRRTLDEQLARSARAHVIRSELRGAMLEASEESALFRKVRELLVFDGGFGEVWMSSLDAAAFGGEGQRQKGSPILDALRTHEPVAVPGGVEVAEAGMRGPCHVVPICDGPHALGVLVASPAPGGAIDEADAWLLADVVRDLAHGVRALRARNERRTMEELLFQSQKMDAIGQLAGGVAHDFNNQLTGILGFAEFLSRKLGDSALREHAELIVRAAERSADLTAQLLAFARKGPFRSEIFDVHGVMRDVVAILERSIDKRIRVVAELGAKAPFVDGDPHQLQNALLNLALNARDAMPNGGVIRLVTRARPEPTAQRTERPGEDPDSLLCIEVIDQGTGISDEVRARMFEPFFTTKPAGKGTGMGLAAVYGTVQRHCGQLEVETEAGRGTVFRVLLPVAREPRAPRSNRPPAPAPKRGRARVVVVDDEPVVAALVQSALEDQGYEVVAFTSPEEALRFFDRGAEQVDLVVLDLVMPGMNGRETFAALRARRKEVPVLLVSGYSLDDEAQTLLERGAAGFLQKPFAVNDLARRVAKALEREEASADEL